VGWEGEGGGGGGEGLYIVSGEEGWDVNMGS